MEVEYRKRIEEWHQRNQFLIAELKKRGIEATPDIPIQNYINTPQESSLIESIIASLDHAPSEEDLQSYICMISGTTPYDGRILISIFDNTTNQKIKSEIIRTSTQSRPFGVHDWFVSILSGQSADTKSRESLAALISFTDNPRQYIPLLLKHYDDLRGSALATLDRIGTVDELEFLKSKRGESYNWPDDVKINYQKYLEKVIAKLEKKAARMKT
jgi:hypothetical protein